MSVVDEGTGVAERDVPLDVHYSKLLDWMQERHVTPKDWSMTAAMCRKEQQSALNGGQGYFDMLEKMKELVEKSEDRSRGLFGGYNDKVLNVAEALLGSFKRNGVHLADLAQTLVQLVKYETPHQARLMEKAQKQLVDLEKLAFQKQEDAEQYARQFRKACEQFEIAGEDVSRELQQQLAEKLPVLFGGVTKEAKKLKPLVDFYNAFRAHVDLLVGHKSSPRCAALLSVIESGLSAPVQRRDEAPSEVVEVVLDPVVEDIQVEEEDLAGIELVGEDSQWDVEIVEMHEGVHESREFRAAVDDILELHAFVQGRIREKSSGDKKASFVSEISTSQGCPELVRVSDSLEWLREKRDVCTEVLRVAQSPQLVQLLEMQSSKRFFSRLTASMRKKLELAENAKLQKEEIKVRQKALVAELERMRDDAKKITQKAQRIQCILQEELGQKFQRKVFVKI